MIDVALVKSRFEKGFSSYSSEAVVQKQMNQHLVAKLKELSPKTDSILEIGCGNGDLTQRFTENFQINNYVANDIVCASCLNLKELELQCHPQEFRFVQGDAQVIDYPDKFSAIISGATFQWFSDLKGMLQKLNSNLHNGGLLAFSTFGPQNLFQVKKLSGVGLEYQSFEEVKSLIPSEYELLYAFEEQNTLQFPSAFDVLKHLKKTGVNGISKQTWTRSKMEAFEQHYRSLYKSRGGVELTYHPMYFILRSKNYAKHNHEHGPWGACASE